MGRMDAPNTQSGGVHEGFFSDRYLSEVVV